MISENNTSAANVTASKGDCLHEFRQLRTIFCQIDIPQNIGTIASINHFRLDKQNYGLNNAFLAIQQNGVHGMTNIA
jgi:hypothetical protein